MATQTNRVNPVLLKLAQSRVWSDAANGEKRAFQPGAAAADPAAAAGAGAPPPGGMPPGGDPAAAAGGAMPPPGGMPMDPAAMGMAPPGMAPPAPAPAGGGGGAGGKPKFDPLMLDYRMYNLQQQLSAIMNALKIEVPPQALIMPPGTMGAPPAEQAMPGAPMDPSQQAAQGGGAGGGSAINPIEPMQGASPEMAMAGGGGGGGAPKMASADWDPKQLQQDLPEDVAEFQKEADANAPTGWRVVLLKSAEGLADTKSTDGNVEEQPGPKKSSPPQDALNVPGAPGKRPATQALTAGGSKDPKSRTEAGDEDGPANKSASLGSQLANLPLQSVGTPVERPASQPRGDSPVVGAAALAAMMRSRTAHGA